MSVCHQTIEWKQSRKQWNALMLLQHMYDLSLYQQNHWGILSVGVSERNRRLTDARIEQSDPLNLNLNLNLNHIRMIKIKKKSFSKADKILKVSCKWKVSQWETVREKIDFSSQPRFSHTVFFVITSSLILDIKIFCNETLRFTVHQ